MLYLGSDHGGFKLKEQIKAYLDKNSIKFKDLGNKTLDPTDDYPDYAKKVTKSIKKNDKGVLLCGSSHGMCIAANKTKGIRAVSVNNVKDAKLTRLHNDANVLCLSGWNTSRRKSIKILKTWLNTNFSNEERHKRRIAKIK